MPAALTQIASLSIQVFAVSSMAGIGLAYDFARIFAPLREFRAVFRALVANFVLVPLLAVAIVHLLPMDAPLALGLFLLAGAAGAPFFIKMAGLARGDLALSASLLLILIPATVVFLPVYVPTAMGHPSLRGLSYVPSSPLELGVPLLATLILPLFVGLGVRAAAADWAARVVPLAGKVATIALVVIILAIFAANAPELILFFTSRALVAAIALVLGSFFIGFLLTRKERAAVLGLGTAQRNIAAAMVIASSDFTDPNILVMITACSLVGLFLLFAIAWILSRQLEGAPSASGAQSARGAFAPGIEARTPSDQRRGPQAAYGLGWQWERPGQKVASHHRAPEPGLPAPESRP